MSFQIPGDVNPFEAPRAMIGEGAIHQDLDDREAEAIRRDHIGHEANIRSLGHLYYLVASLGAIGMVVGICVTAGLVTNGANGNPASGRDGIDGLATLVFAAFTAATGTVGYGLTHLRGWARWVGAVLNSLGMLVLIIDGLVLAALVKPMAGVVFLVGLGGFDGFFLYLLMSRKSNVVFSAEYREVVLKTPHVKLKGGIALKVVLVLILGCLVMAWLGGLFGRS